MGPAKRRFSTAFNASFTMIDPKTLLIATHNEGKLQEFAAMLALPGVTFTHAGALGLPEPEETESTFIGNALLKARAAAKASNLPSLADDSGLAVEALNGDPGIYSARWADVVDGRRDFSTAIQKVEKALQNKGVSPTGAKASFISVLALVLPDGSEITAEGRVDGHLVFPARGTNGFGYDPIFIPENETRVFAEMSMDEKSKFSHRARAVAALKKKLA